MARHLKAATRWFDALPAVTAEIDCGGEAHRITWRRGKLVLEDHDVLAERSLTALGAKPPMCVEVLDAWRGMRGTELLHELLLKDRTLSPEEVELRRAVHQGEMAAAKQWPPGIPAHWTNHPHWSVLVDQLRRQSAERLEREERMWAITLIEALPPALRRALALSVIVGVERHWHDEGFRGKHARDVESALTAITLPLFEQSVRHWRRNLKAHATFVVESWLRESEEEATCAGWVDGAGAYAALSLPLSWFTEVWTRGIALVDGCFVVELTGRSPDGTELRVRALRWERPFQGTSRLMEAPALLTQQRAGGEWRLHWA